MQAIEKIQRHATRIKNGNAKVQPGQPHRISEAASAGDGVWQGDLGIAIIESVPSGYTKLRRAGAVQLVPGNTQGSKHVLTAESDAEVFLPSGWGDGYEGLAGPVIVCRGDSTITHPTHGDVTVPAGFAVQCRYQREWDAELRRERRNAD